MFNTNYYTLFTNYMFSKTVDRVYLSLLTPALITPPGDKYENAATCVKELVYRYTHA